MEMKPAGLFVLLGLIFFLTGCGNIPTKIDKDPFGLKSGDISASEHEEIRRIILLLEKKNAGLKTVKGIGKIKIYNDKKFIYSRLAWIEDASRKIRMEFLGIDGRPVMSMAVDEKRFYAYSHPDRRFYTRKRSDNSLEPALSIELSYDTVAAFLMGQIPLPEYYFARFGEDTAGDGYILSLWVKGSGDVERIFFNRDKTRVSRVEYYRGDGELVYRVMFNGYRQVQSYGFFSTIAITDGKNAGLEMAIEQFWVNVPVDPSVFELSDRAE